MHPSTYRPGYHPFGLFKITKKKRKKGRKNFPNLIYVYLFCYPHPLINLQQGSQNKLLSDERKEKKDIMQIYTVITEKMILICYVHLRAIRPLRSHSSFRLPHPAILCLSTRLLIPTFRNTNQCPPAIQWSQFQSSDERTDERQELKDVTQAVAGTNPSVARCGITRAAHLVLVYGRMDSWLAEFGILNEW